MKTVKKQFHLQNLFTYWLCCNCSVWTELGTKYEGTDYIIGKMDATVNEVEGYPPLHSFPTIRLYRKDGTQVGETILKNNF